MSVTLVVFRKNLLYANSMIKKLILLGFGLMLLIGLPLAIFVLQNQNQTTTTSGAAPVTKFSFSGPKQVDTNTNFDENLVVDPGGSNQVSFVKFAFTYDPSFIDKQAAPVSIDTNTYTILEQPTVNCASNLCTVTGTISIGSNQNALIKTATTVAVVHLIAKKDTIDPSGTQLAFVNGQNQALSVGGSDQAAENVFQSGVASTIIIGNQSGGGSPTDTPSPTDSGGTGGSSGGGNSGGTGGTSGGGSNVSVACTSFTADKTTGNPPLTVTFTTVGSSSTDSIVQLNLFYGDGTTDTVASGSGIGTGNVNNQISHNYASNGTFNAYAVLTTESGAASDKATCNQTITVGAIAASASAGPAKLPPTGPGQTFVLIGVAGAILTAIGLVVIAGL